MICSTRAFLVRAPPAADDGRLSPQILSTVLNEVKSNLNEIEPLACMQGWCKIQPGQLTQECELKPHKGWWKYSAESKLLLWHDC